MVGDLPVGVLVDECPLYDLEPVAAIERPVRGAASRVLTGDEPPAETLLALLRSPNIASRRPVFEQYDPIVQSRTVRRPERGRRRGARRCPDGVRDRGLDRRQRRGASPAIRAAAPPRRCYECAANLACVGAEPLGLTNCLNFGNPEKPHVAWQLIEAVEGLAEACEALGVPVVGGNVSLYNEAPSGPIFPTPVVGMVGKLPDAARAGRLGFARRGRRDRAGRPVRALDASAPSSRKLRGRGAARASCRPIDAGRLSGSRIEAVRARMRSGALHSAHDIAEGGVAIALAECCIAGGIGASVRLPHGLDPFGEAPGRAFIVSGPLEALAGFVVIGEVGGETLAIEGLLELAVSELRAARDAGLAEWV